MPGFLTLGRGCMFFLSRTRHSISPFLVEITAADGLGNVDLLVNRRQVFISSSWVPTALIAPFSITTMRSAFSTLETRCEMISLVVSGISSAKALRIFASVAVSTALVESSRIRIFGFFSRALAMQRRCRWPPETLVPPCSILVL